MKAEVVLIGPLLALAAHAARAEDWISSDRPGIADSSDVIAAGVVQVESGIQREARRPGDDPARRIVAPTLLRLGIGENRELRFESEIYGRTRSSDGELAQALAPFSLGAKYRLRESLAAIVRISPPSGTKSLRTQRTTADVRLAADLELTSSWSLNPNVGWAWDEDDEGRRFNAAIAAATISYRPTRQLELFLDAGVQAPEAKGGRTAVVYDGGLAYLPVRDVQVDISFGVRGAGVTLPRTFLGAGFSLRF